MYIYGYKALIKITWMVWSKHHSEPEEYSLYMYVVYKVLDPNERNIPASCDEIANTYSKGMYTV
jgi:hypothetical protein